MNCLKTISESGTIENMFSLSERFYSLKYEGNMEELFSIIQQQLQV